jgi:hypothetical protein
MRYAVLAFIDTDRTPCSIIEEIVSTLTFDAMPATDVVWVTVLTDDGYEVATYTNKEER